MSFFLYSMRNISRIQTYLNIVRSYVFTIDLLMDLDYLI